MFEAEGLEQRYMGLEESEQEYIEQEELEDLKWHINRRIVNLQNIFEFLRGAKYWFINAFGMIEEIKFGKWLEADRWRVALGNCFLTEGSAVHYLDSLCAKAELKQLAQELNSENKIHWQNYKQHKYYIYYDNARKCIEQDFETTKQQANVIYCTDEKFLEKAIQKIGTDRIIKMVKADL